MVFKYNVFTLPMSPCNSLILRGISQRQNLKSFLNNKQVHFTNPKILLSINKTDSSYSIKTIKTAQYVIQKVFSRNSSSEVHSFTKR